MNTIILYYKSKISTKKMAQSHQMVDFCQKMQNSNSRKIALIKECGDMPTIKDALGSINKLSCKEQESLKNHVFKTCFC